MSLSKVAVTLLRFVKSRENALRIAGALSLTKAEACSKITRYAQQYRDRGDEVMLRVIPSLEADLRLLLPHEKSRFQKERKTILDLLNQCHD
jgi:hypothetical protein